MLERHGEAARHYEKALKLNPSYAEAHNNLGNAMAALGHHEQAIASYEKALAIKPIYAEAHSNLASALMALGRSLQALAHCEQALAIRPNYFEAHLSFAGALLAVGRREEARAQYHKALSLNPVHAEARVNLGCLLLELGSPEEAISQFQAALITDPEQFEGYNGLGTAFQAMGRLDEAIAAFEKATVIAPRKTAAFLNLANATRLAADDARFIAMQSLAREIERLDVEDQFRLHFALGKVLDAQGDGEASFQHLLKGNRLKRQQVTYDEEKTIAWLSRIQAEFSAEALRVKRGLAEPSNVPIFIVGMPRSGTTLIEQILASHPHAFGAGEFRELGQLAASLRASDGSKFPECVLALSDEQLHDLGCSYVRSLRKIAPAAERITDKMPYNFAYVGLIHLALPNARILHVRRDPRDTAFSCFSIMFHEGQEFTYDLAELGRYIRGYENIMEHWRRVLPRGSMLELQYEDVVDNLEDEARRMLSYCGLEWNDRCLAFHETKRPVSTASVNQVRQPIYSSSIGRWRAFERELQPLIEVLSNVSR
jgi:tetratricopeptide (TPR) repeat protein